MKTHITYRNIYCAMCNGALGEHNDTTPIQHLSFWKAHVVCENETIDDVAAFSLDTLADFMKVR